MANKSEYLAKLQERVLNAAEEQDEKAAPEIVS